MLNYKTINRTKVELKFINNAVCTGTSKLSIVPKWNWNRWNEHENQYGIDNYQSYQSGIEIIKIYQFSSPSAGTINRTKVELKCVPRDLSKEWEQTINRTKVELKSKSVVYNIIIMANYQSYQSGIEIVFEDLSRQLAEFYQSYQSGIEIKLKGEYNEILKLSIVPKWNWNMGKVVSVARVWTINRTKVELK